MEISPLGRELVATAGYGPSFIAPICCAILYGYVSVFTLNKNCTATICREIPTASLTHPSTLCVKAMLLVTF